LWAVVDGASGRGKPLNGALVDRVDGFPFLVLEKKRKKKKERERRKKSIKE
jgi:hypothetical protein